MTTLAGIDARAKLAFLAVFMVATLRAATLAAVGACLAAAVLLACAVRLDARAVRAVLVPIAPIVLFTVVMQALVFPEGPVALQVGAFALSQRAAVETARMAACLLALVLASLAFMRCTAVEDLLAVLRWLLAPLRRMGLRPDAFILSLSVAMGFAPVLVDEFSRLRAAQAARGAEFDGSLPDRLKAYTRLFAPLLHSAFGHADGLADALLARGFSCVAAPTSLHPGRFGAAEAVCLAAGIVLAVIVACV